MEALQWAVGILVTINIGVTGFIASQLWAHVIKCSHVSAQLGQIGADVERMKQDIGTHDTGMRGDLHRTGNMCMAHEMRIAVLERGRV